MGNRKTKVLVLTLAMLGLSACGGGKEDNKTSDPGNENDKDNIVVNLTGIAADGYLVGAKVCLDKNENGECDADEPKAVTGSGGAYTLSNVNKTDAVKYPIVVEVSVNTVDEDTGIAVGKAYFMSAPANSGGFVSPMTTMVHSKLQSNPALSLDEAEDSVIESLGFDPNTSAISLFEDYVAAKSDTGNLAVAREYAHLHNVARVTASVIADNFEAVTTTAESEGITVDALLLVIVNQVIDKLDSIADDVATATADTGGVLAEDDLSDISNSVASTVNTENLAAQVAEIELVKETTSEVDLLNWIANGFTWLSADGDEYVYGAVSKGSGNTVSEQNYYYEDGNWRRDDVVNELDKNVKLTSMGWQNTPDSNASYRYQLASDGRLELKELSTGENLLSITSVLTSDAAGKSIRQFIITSGDEGLSAFGVNASAVFSTEAEAHYITVEESESYGIGYHPCNENQAAYTVGSGTNCSVAWGGAVALQTLSAVIGVTHYIGPQLSVTISGSADDAGGSATFTHHAFDNSIIDTIEKNWVRKTMNGEEMIIVDIPKSLRQYSWDGEEVSKVFYSMHDGYVRLGWFESSVTFSFWAFNQTALDDLKTHFSPDVSN